MVHTHTQKGTSSRDPFGFASLVQEGWLKGMTENRPIGSLFLCCKRVYSITLPYYTIIAHYDAERL